MRAVTCALAVVVCVSATPAYAFPEFQSFIEESSGRNVDCAFCHAHADGPKGNKPGQLDGLDASELDRLRQAQLALEPGTPTDSPILNAFGNRILESTGKVRFAVLRQNPAELAEHLGDADMDGDGISDAREYLEGTHPLIASSGSPWSLFVHNARALAFHLGMLVVATLLGLFGLNHLLRWFGIETARMTSTRQPTKDTAADQSQPSLVGDMEVVEPPQGAIRPRPRAGTASGSRRPFTLDDRMDGVAVDLVAAGVVDLSQPDLDEEELDEEGEPQTRDEASSDAGSLAEPSQSDPIS